MNAILNINIISESVKRQESSVVISSQEANLKDCS